MNNLIYEEILKAIMQEFSSMGGGAVGGVATPLGSGPQAGKNGGNIYKSQKASDKKYRSKGKRKKSYTRSVQHYLKNGPEKGRKRTFQEVFKYYLGQKLSEARTFRIKDFKKSEIIAFLRYLKGEVQDDITFSTTEKIAGQSMTVGIKGSNSGNIIYCATKDALMQSDNNIFSYRFMKSKATSGLVKKAFMRNFRTLSPEEEIVLGMEIVIDDYKKPDYIAYHVPRGKEYAAIFSIKPEGSFTRHDANRLSGQYWSRRQRKNTELKVLLPEDIPLIPELNLDEEVIREIDELIQMVQNSPTGRGNDIDTPVKSYIDREISPRIRSLVKIIFPSSNINASSPIEGIAVNMQSGENTSFFKVPSEEFNKLQSIQAAVYAEFRSNKYTSSTQRAQGFLDQLNNPTTNQSFARNTFKLIKYLNETNILPLNYRTFFSPTTFRSFCGLMKQGLENMDVKTITSALDLFSKKLYTSKGNETFTSNESQELVQFIDQNNLI